MRAGSVAAVVVGTRPEAVKLAPVVVALRAQGLIIPVVVATGQQRDAVDEVLDVFGLAAGTELAPVGQGRSVTELTSHLLHELDGALEGIRPDLVVVQGDTASVLAGALAGFLRGVPVVHVEAGLRTGDLAAPFPGGRQPADGQPDRRVTPRADHRGGDEPARRRGAGQPDCADG